MTHGHGPRARPWLARRAKAGKIGAPRRVRYVRGVTRPKAIVVGWTLALGSLLAGLLMACGGPGGIHARMGYSEEHGVRVVDVPPGSAAERGGLRNGDRIVSIEGTPTSDLAYQEVVERLRGTSGTRVEIEVERDGEVVPLELLREPYQR